MTRKIYPKNEQVMRDYHDWNVLEDSLRLIRDMNEDKRKAILLGPNVGLGVSGSILLPNSAVSEEETQSSVEDF